MKKSLAAAVVLALVLGFAIRAISSGEAVAPAKTAWLTDDQTAFTAARNDEKPMLIDFTGTTWCPACIALEKEVFSTQKFDDYSKKFVLLKVDFPDAISIPPKAEKLIEKYLSKEIMLPTIVVVSPKGEKLGEVNYTPGGPDRFIGAVEMIVKK